MKDTTNNNMRTKITKTLTSVQADGSLMTIVPIPSRRVDNNNNDDDVGCALQNPQPDALTIIFDDEKEEDTYEVLKDASPTTTTTTTEPSPVLLRTISKTDSRGGAATSVASMSTHESLCGSSDHHSRPSQASYFSDGRDFYDDDYSSESEDSVQDRLDFTKLNVKGREQDVQRLHDVYSHVQRLGIDLDAPRDMKQEKAAAMIQGVSGTGKSTLVKKFVQAVETQSRVAGGPKKPHLLCGKCDELSGGDPFSAIVEALSGFANTLLLVVEKDDSQQQDELERIQTAVQAVLGPPEAQALATMIPALRQVLRMTEPHQQQEAELSSSSGSKENAWNRLKYILQVFTRAISTMERPVVMFLDDLQWCDAASLELLEALLTDQDLKYMMFIGAYRSDEVTAGHHLLQTLATIENTQSLETIELVNLTFSEFHDFVADVLRKDCRQEALDDTRTLAQVIHTKTCGNIFFAIQVLEELQRKGILLFSRMTFEWEWNLSEVQNLDDLLSDNVLAAVTAKIQSASPLLQRALILAAYTRSTVDIDILQYLLLKLDGHTIASLDLVKLLDDAVVDGLLSNSMGSKSYSFAHDRIQQASYAMVSTGRARDELRLNLGLRLYELAKSSSSMSLSDPLSSSSAFGGGRQDEWMLFVAADHLNATAFQVRATLGDMFLIKLNLEVGERAASVAAYEMASKFLGLALQCLLQGVNNPWQTEYETTLKIYRCMVDVELCQGHFELGTAIGQKLLQHAKSTPDKVPTQIALVKALGRENKHRGSFDLSVEALRSLREYPRSLVGVQVSLVKNFLYVKRYLKQNSDEDILRLPFMTDERHIHTMELLSCTAYQAFNCGKKIEFLVAVLRCLRLTFQHGLCGHSGVAMMGWTLFLDTLQDMGGVTRFSRLARDILNLTKAKEQECLQLFVVAYWISTWRDTHEDVLEIYNRAHLSGMESGDFVNGLLSRTASYHHEFLAGYSLAQLDTKFSNLVDKLDLYKVDFVKVMTVEQWLVVQHLRGTAQTPLNFAELESFGSQNHDGSDNYQVLYGCMGRIQLGVYFGNCKFSDMFMNKIAPLANLDCAHSPNSVRLFFGSLTYATLARETKKNSFRKKAKKYASELKNMCKLKGMNSWHRCLLAEAHCHAESAKSGKNIQIKYDHAIAFALKSGNVQDAALGWQLVAEYFLSIPDKILPDPHVAKARELTAQQYLTRARDLYLQWGAKRLVRHLEKKYSLYLVPSPASAGDEQTSDDLGCCGKTFNSMGPGESFQSLPSMPKMIVHRPGDEVSVFSDNDQSLFRVGIRTQPMETSLY